MESSTRKTRQKKEKEKKIRKRDIRNYRYNRYNAAEIKSTEEPQTNPPTEPIRLLNAVSSMMELSTGE